MTDRKLKNGFTLVELALVMVVSGIVISSLFVGFYSEVKSLQMQRALRSATVVSEDLMNEIRSKAFCDPAAPNSWAEEGTSNRINYDDVDDYDMLSNSPPQTIEGAALTNLAGFSCRVWVTNVPYSDFNAAGNFPHGSTDFLKVTISVGNRDIVLTNKSVVSRYD